MGQPQDNKAALLYGDLIEAAYEMFKNPKGDPLKPDPDKIPPGYELGAWIQMSDFFGGITKPLIFYGIVVHEVQDPDSRVIAIRGTERIVEWIDDADAVRAVPFTQVPTVGKVASGFDRIYTSIKIVKRHLTASAAENSAADTFKGSFLDQLDQLATSREIERGVRASAGDADTRQRRPTVVAGHSLGGALGTLFVMENHAKPRFNVSTLCTFASPRVGFTEFVTSFNALPINSWRNVNIHDFVPKLPFRIPGVWPYDHVATPYPFDSSLFAKHNLGCYHNMKTYLHALDKTRPLDDCKRP
jgi:lipase (class 3)